MTKPKPTGFKKWLFEAPSWLYRARVGFLMGKRFLMIEHRGRKSGNLYRTVVEVVDRTPEGEWIVVSGYGAKADWYQNLRRGNLEAVWVGSRRHQASMRFLEPDEATEVMAEYERLHSKAAELIYRELDLSHDETDEGRLEMVKQIPMVAFRIQGSTTPSL